MANITLTNLPPVIALNGTEPLLGVQSGSSVQITTGQIASLAKGGGGNTPFPVSIGGTGVSTFSVTNGILLGNGTNALTQIAAPAGTNYVLVGSTGGTYSWQPTIPVTAGVDSVSFGTTGLTPSTAQAGIISVAFGSLPTAAGIYSPATNQIALSTASTQRLLIDASGNLTISGPTTAPSYIANESITSALFAGAFSYGVLGYSDTNILGSFTTSVNSYDQFIVQNTNSGTTASTNVIVSNNLGTSSTYYGEFGMNSSGFTGSGAFNAANTVYLDATSADLAIGTTTANAIHFVVNGSGTDAATISSSGVFSLATPLAVGSGGTGANTLTGYVYGNGTSAMTASTTIPSSAITGLGTMATQNANAVAITGGSINGTTIGATTAAAGTFLSLTDSGNITFTGSGSLFLADFTNATLTSRFAFQTSTANSTTGIYALPSGTSTAASWQATNNSVITNASKILIATNGTTDVQLVSGINGTGTYLPLSFYTNGSGQFAINTSGAWGIGSVAGATVNYGTSGQLYVSGGSAAQPSWTNTVSAATTFSTSITSPIHYGGTTSSSTLTLQSTSGAGSTDSIVFKVGNAGAVTAMTISTTGAVSTASTISDSIGNVRTIVQNSQTTAYTLVATDNGKFISITTGGVTVPASVFSAGQNIVIFNNSSSTQTITQGSSVTMTLAGSTTTGNRSLASYGVATVLCTGTNTFVITGQGLT
jgi:hypothetical protein